MKEDTKEIILQTALELFAKKGFDACSMNDVAAAAKVNKATIYYYFSSKEKIYHAVLAHILENFYARLLKAVSKEETAQKKLMAYIYAFGENFKDTQKIAPLMLRELASSGENLSDDVRKILFNNITLLSDIIESGYHSGVFRRQEIFPLYLMIVGTMNMYTATNKFRKKVPAETTLSGFNLDSKALADYILAIVRQGIDSEKNS